MGRKGFDRHNRKFQATQQVASKFSQKPAVVKWFNYLEVATIEPDSVKQLINKIVK